MEMSGKFVMFGIYTASALIEMKISPFSFIGRSIRSEDKPITEKFIPKSTNKSPQIINISLRF
jgi:hypothetical protein